MMVKAGGSLFATAELLGRRDRVLVRQHLELLKPLRDALVHLEKLFHAVQRTLVLREGQTVRLAAGKAGVKYLVGQRTTST